MHLNLDEPKRCGTKPENDIKPELVLYLVTKQESGVPEIINLNNGTDNSQTTFKDEGNITINRTSVRFSNPLQGGWGCLYASS